MIVDITHLGNVFFD